MPWLSRRAAPAAVLFDRDGTLVEDVPYNADPGRVRPMPLAREALDTLRAQGVAVGVVSNQSGVARGLLTEADVAAVQRRVEDLLGPFAVWAVCPHGPEDGCRCRKPGPGLIEAACAELGVLPGHTVVVGDIEADLAAAHAAGARGVLVPTPATRPEETAQAARAGDTAPDVLAAVHQALRQEPARPEPARPEPAPAGAAPAPAGLRTLVVRLDSAGDVLLAGPAVRAVAAASAHTVLLCGTQGEAAGRLLPGVAEAWVYDAPWVGFEPPAAHRGATRELVARIAAARFDRALVLASAHQSPLPAALLLKLAGVPWVTADSEHYPGSLLDVRHRRAPGRHEADAALDLARAAGFPLPAGDDGGLRVTRPPETSWLTGTDPYLVVHPGAAVPARAWSPTRAARAVAALAAAGHRVVVTGSPGEKELTAAVAGRHALDLGGRTGLPELAGVLAGADVVVTGNTGPAHLAAAVGTPVASLFAPVVPAWRWLPYRVPHVRLGRQEAACAGTRARVCPVPGHPCLDGVTDAEVLDAVATLTGGGAGASGVGATREVS